jgi:exodeoxyribonuclease V alpha subunit
VVATVDGAARFAYWRRLARHEDVLANLLSNAAVIDPPSLGENIEFAAASSVESEQVRQLLTSLLRRSVTILTGGPGTGKTTSIANALSAVHRAAVSQEQRFTVALVAPTAKAAVRLVAAVADSLADANDPFGLHVTVTGSVHHLLGLHRDLDDSEEPVSEDFVIVDECSMLELALLSQLLRRAIDRRVVLIGDPDQLASVNVGAALRDVVDAARGPLAPLLVSLTRNFRSEAPLLAFANAMQRGDVTAAIAIAKDSPHSINLVSDREALIPQVLARVERLATAALADDADGAFGELENVALLCATREGPGSVAHWRRVCEPLVRTGAHVADRFAPGTPVLVVRNEAGVDGLNNGDLGVVVGTNPTRALFDGTPRRERATDQLGAVEAAWAMTIHKSQGSEYNEVVVSLPDVDGPILTRELLYTAVTRARRHVTIVGAPSLWAAALARRVDRVSGLSERILVRGEERGMSIDVSE